MSTTDQLITRGKVILARQNDANLNASLLTELIAAQERLEQEAWLPDFLYQEDVFSLTTSTFDLATTFTRFLRLHERGFGISFVPVSAPTSEPQHLKQYDTMEQMLQLFPGALAAGDDPKGYCKIDTFVRVRPSPSVAVPASLQVAYYQGELPVAIGNTNLWTQKAADYLLGNAGKFVAASLRDDTASQIFQGLEASGKARLMKKSFGDEQADQEYVMGDRD